MHMFTGTCPTTTYIIIIFNKITGRWQIINVTFILSLMYYCNEKKGIKTKKHLQVLSMAFLMEAWWSRPHPTIPASHISSRISTCWDVFRSNLLDFGFIIIISLASLTRFMLYHNHYAGMFLRNACSISVQVTSIWQTLATVGNFLLRLTRM